MAPRSAPAHRSCRCGPCFALPSPRNLGRCPVSGHDRGSDRWTRQVRGRGDAAAAGALVRAARHRSTWGVGSAGPRQGRQDRRQRLHRRATPGSRARRHGQCLRVAPRRGFGPRHIDRHLLARRRDAAPAAADNLRRQRGAGPDLRLRRGCRRRVVGPHRRSPGALLRGRYDAASCSATRLSACPGVQGPAGRPHRSRRPACGGRSLRQRRPGPAADQRPSGAIARVDRRARPPSPATTSISCSA